LGLNRVLFVIGATALDSVPASRPENGGADPALIGGEALPSLAMPRHAGSASLRADRWPIGQ